GADDGFQMDVDLQWRPVERYYHQVGPCYGDTNTWKGPTLTTWHDYTFGLGWYGCLGYAPEEDKYWELYDWGGEGFFSKYRQRLIDFNLHYAQVGNPGFVPLSASYVNYQTGESMAGRHRFSLRILGGKAEGLYQGLRIWGPVDIPPECIGDRWGIDALHIRMINEIVEEHRRNFGVRVLRWQARPISGSLGSYPKVLVIGTSQGTATGNSLVLTYPDGTQNGDRATIWIATKGTTPNISGWTRTQKRENNSGLTLACYQRDIVDTNDVAVTLTAGNGLVGVVLVERGANPGYNMTPTFGEATAPSTSTVDPSANKQFGPKVQYWAAASEDSADIVVPDGYSEAEHTPPISGIPSLCVGIGESEYTIITTGTSAEGNV